MTSPSHLLIVGKSRPERLRYAVTHEAKTEHFDADLLPFRRFTGHLESGGGPRLIRIDDAERAFPDQQTSGTRLVLTQSSYLVQTWLDSVRESDRILLTADRLSLKKQAPAAFERRGPWRQFRIIDLDEAHAVSEGVREDAMTAQALEWERQLVAAYSSPIPEDRLALCRHAVELSPGSAISALALASACRECQATDEARDAMDRALSLAPDWAAAHYEDGKFWLACEDMEHARAAFERASHAMPTFTAAWSNLGATLGELDRPVEALTAFRQALQSDPDSFLVLNNIGVVARELGRFDESEAALKQVNRIAPEFVFGHYNLGHTLLLAGRVNESLTAYQEGRRRDAEKNRRQGSRLAVVHLLRGDVETARTLLWESVDGAPAEEREDLLLEAYEIIRTFAPDPSPPQAAFLDDIAKRL